MRPFSDINVGDVYQSYLGGEWVVLQKNAEERMVEVCLIGTTLNYNPPPIWKRNTDSLFNKKVLDSTKFGANQTPVP